MFLQFSVKSVNIMMNTIALVKLTAEKVSHHLRKKTILVQKLNLKYGGKKYGE